MTKVFVPFKGFKVDELLSYVQRSARRLEAHAQVLKDDLIVKIYHGTESVKETSNDVQVRVKEIHRSVSAVGQNVRNISARYEQHEERIGSRIDELKDFWEQQIQDALASQNGLFQMLRDVVNGELPCPYY